MSRRRYVRVFLAIGVGRANPHTTNDRTETASAYRGPDYSQESASGNLSVLVGANYVRQSAFMGRPSRGDVATIRLTSLV